MSERILIVEDETIVALDLKLRLEEMGYQVVGLASSGEEAVRKAEATDPTVALMDVYLGPGMDGIEAAGRITESRDIPVIYLTAFADGHTLERAKQTSPYGYLTKPFDERALHTTIEMALYRHRMEAVLRESESRFRALIENSRDLVTVLDGNGRVRYASPSAEKVLGFPPSDMLGTDGLKLVHPEDLAIAQAALRYMVTGQERLTSVEFRVRHRDGSWRILETVGQNALDVPGVEGIVLHSRDLTDRRQAEEERRRIETQMQEAQKLESLGVLAGGIAHDFNNLLMGILGNAGLALLELPPDSPIRARIKQIELASLRAAELTNQMLAYSGKGKFLVQTLSLTKLVEEMAFLLQTVISKKAVLKFEFAANLPPIEADATQLRQVVMNLITNASDALEDTSGYITIRTGLLEGRSDQPCFAGKVPDGYCAFLEVADSGTGMDPETLAKIFDPFFTTKFTGRGLGLAAVLGIVRSHHGAIQVRSDPGKGTTFRLLFPVAPVPEDDGRRAPTGPQPYVGHGTVLVVDDEETVRAVAKMTLERHGFEVLTAHDGSEALRIFGESGASIRALVLDLTMPHVGGVEVLQTLRAQGGPGASVPILLSSGYTEVEVAKYLEADSGVQFLHKPYRPVELVEKIAACLGD